MVDAGTWNGWWLAAAGARAPCRSRCVCSTHTRRGGRAGGGGRWPVPAGCGLRSCTERPGSGRARAGRRQEARAHPEQASSQEGSVGIDRQGHGAALGGGASGRWRRSPTRRRSRSRAGGSDCGGSSLSGAQGLAACVGGVDLDDSGLVRLLQSGPERPTFRPERSGQVCNQV